MKPIIQNLFDMEPSEAMKKRIKDREAVQVPNPIKGLPDKIKQPPAIVGLPVDPAKK